MDFYQITRSQEQDQKWNEFIMRSPHGRLYALTPLLDALCPGWLPYTDSSYKYIFPLTRFKKGIFTVADQPFFLQQLGVFSSDGSYPDLNVLYNQILQPMRRVQIHFHAGWNGNLRVQAPYSVSSRKNYILPLDKTLLELQKNFRENTKRNIKKSIYAEIREIGMHEYISFAQEAGLYADWQIRKRDLESLLTGLSQSAHYIKFHINAVFNEGHIVAAGILVHFQDRLIYISGGSSKTGAENRAMFALINEWISMYAETEKILDFEGSNIPGIARFFEGFGAISENYPALYRARFPFK